MLFDGLPPDSSCEWRGLISFIAAYNSRYGTAYGRDVCADVEFRDKPALEVLLKSPGEPPIAIERKSIAWPKDEHLADQRKEERFTERFVAAVGIGDGAFDEALSRLVVHEKSIRDRNMWEVESAATSIGSVVASRLEEAKSHGGLAGNRALQLELWPRACMGKRRDYPCERSRSHNFRTRPP